MEIKLRKLEELKPFIKNPNKHPEKQLKMLEKSIKEFGFLDPIQICQEDMIVAGHARYMVATKLGLEYVPTIYHDMPYEKAVAYCISHNQLARLAEEDRELLGELLPIVSDIPDFDFEATGFTQEDYDLLLSDSSISYDEEEEETYEEDSEEEDGEEGTGLGITDNYSIASTLVFNNESEQRVWYNYMRWLKEKYPDSETNSERIILDLDERGILN